MLYCRNANWWRSVPTSDFGKEVLGGREPSARTAVRMEGEVEQAERRSFDHRGEEEVVAQKVVKAWEETASVKRVLLVGAG